MTTVLTFYYILPRYPLIQHIFILKCDTYSDTYFSYRHCLQSCIAAKILHSKKFIRESRDRIF